MYISLCSLPEQHIVFKQAVHPASVFQPRQIGTDGAAYQDILLKVHCQPVVGKQLLQDGLKAKRFLADAGDLIPDFQHLVDVVLCEIGYIFRGSGVAGMNTFACRDFTISSVFR